VGTDRPLQEPRPAVARHDAEIDEGLAELRFVRSDAQVAHEGEVAAGADCRPVHRRDESNFGCIHRARNALDAVAVVMLHFRG